MKTILTRTAIAALAIASFGFAACAAGVEAKPQDAPGNAGSSQQAPAQTGLPRPPSRRERGQLLLGDQERVPAV